MLETCMGGPRPIRLCVEKTKNYSLKPAGEALGLLVISVFGQHAIINCKTNANVMSFIILI